MIGTHRSPFPPLGPEEGMLWEKQDHWTGSSSIHVFRDGRWQAMLSIPGEAVNGPLADRIDLHRYRQLGTPEEIVAEQDRLKAELKAYADIGTVEEIASVFNESEALLGNMLDDLKTMHKISRDLLDERIVKPSPELSPSNRDDHQRIIAAFNEQPE